MLLYLQWACLALGHSWSLRRIQSGLQVQSTAEDTYSSWLGRTLELCSMEQLWSRRPSSVAFPRHQHPLEEWGGIFLRNQHPGKFTTISFVGNNYGLCLLSTAARQQSCSSKRNTAQVTPWLWFLPRLATGTPVWSPTNLSPCLS